MKKRTKSDITCDRFDELMIQGKEAEAEAFLREKLQKTRGRAARSRMLSRLGTLVLSQGRREEGVELFEDAERADGKDPACALDTARALLYGLRSHDGCLRKAAVAIEMERDLKGCPGAVYHAACQLRGEVALHQRQYKTAGGELLNSLNVDDWTPLQALGPELLLVADLAERGLQKRACRRYLREVSKLAREWGLLHVLEQIEELNGHLRLRSEDPPPG